MPNQSYPKVPIRAWQTLRARAAAAPTTKFTPSNVAALLGIATSRSAQDNIVSPMRRLGLIDEDGNLTARGNKWRADQTFAEACQEILNEVYPEELSMLTDEAGNPDGTKVRQWFDHQGFGDSNARQMAATYLAVAEKKVPGSDESKPVAAKARTTKKVANVASSRPRGQKQAEARGVEIPVEAPSASPTREGPTVHLDIQIHIPVDANSEQIDQIFSSMAKHLYGT